MYLKSPFWNLSRARQWLLVVLIGIPAILLAILGIWAGRMERVARDQSIRNQQEQVTRLIDASLANAIGSVQESLRLVKIDDLIERRGTPTVQGAENLFVVDRNEVISFTHDRVFFGAFGVRPEWMSPPNPGDLEMEMLIEEAQTFEAQGRSDEASNLYQTISQRYPTLAVWSRWAAMRTRYRSGLSNTLELPPAVELGHSEARSPSGLPVALLVSAEASRLTEQERVALRKPLFEILSFLRQGHWWLSYEERRYHDSTLIEVLRKTGENTLPVVDHRLHSLIRFEQRIRYNPPGQRNTAFFHFGAEGSQPGLMLYAALSDHPGSWTGLILEGPDLNRWLESALGTLLLDASYQVTLRNSLGNVLWSSAEGGEPPLHALRLSTFPQLEVAFTGVREGGWKVIRRISWYLMIGLLIFMLTGGLVLASRLMQQRMEVARMQSEFLATVTHEFKSPITGIRLLSDRLARGRVRSPEDSRGYFNSIAQELDRLEWLINRLLTSHQIQAGSKQYRLVPASLVEIVTSTVELLRPQAEAKSIDLRLTLSDSIPELFLDRASISDVLRNLVDNAIRYSPPGTNLEVNLTLETSSVRLEVKDQGVGIEPEDLKRIFDKFYRGRRGNAQDVRGTGLGLALVKAAVDAHGAEITVTSTPGKGSCFTVQFPLTHTHPDGAYIDRRR